MPSVRVTRILHLVVLGIFLVETVYWLAQPCIGDFMCATMGGVYFGGVLLVLAFAVLIWRAGGRASPLIVVDTLLVSVLLPLTMGWLLGGLESVHVIVLGVVPFLLVVGAYGALTDLADHRLERVLTIVVLVGGGSWFAVNGAAPLAIGPAIVVALLISGRVRRDVTDSA